MVVLKIGIHGLDLLLHISNVIVLGINLRLQFLDLVVDCASFFCFETFNLCCCRSCLRKLISLRRSLISRISETFSCMMRMLSCRWTSESFANLRLRLSTDFSKYSRCLLYSLWMSLSNSCFLIP